MQLFHLLVTRYRRAAHTDAVHQNPIGKQYLQYIAIAGIATVFAAVTDDEYDFTASLLARTQIHCRSQNGVVEYASLLCGRNCGGCAALDWNVIDRWSFGAQRSAQHRDSVILAMVGFHLVQHCVQSLAHGAEVGHSPDRRAVAVNRYLIELAERSLQSPKGLIDFLYVYVGHTQIKDYCGRDRQGIAGKEVQDTLVAVLIHGEILGQ